MRLPFLPLTVVLFSMCSIQARWWSTRAPSGLEYGSHSADRNYSPTDPTLSASSSFFSSSPPLERISSTLFPYKKGVGIGVRRNCPFYSEPGSSADCSCFLPSHMRKAEATLNMNAAGLSSSLNSEHQGTVREPKVAPVASLYECVRGMPYSRDLSAFYYPHAQTYADSTGENVTEFKNASEENSTQSLNSERDIGSRLEESAPVKRRPELGLAIGLNELVALDFEGNLELKATFLLQWTDTRLRWLTRVWACN